MYFKPGNTPTDAMQCNSLQIPANRAPWTLLRLATTHCNSLRLIAAVYTFSIHKKYFLNENSEIVDAVSLPSVFSVDQVK